MLTHPAQYYAPWFRYITEREPALALTVLYATSPTARQQGVGFGRPFSWDVPLVEGYDARFARPARDDDRFDAAAFRGIDVPDIGRRLLDTKPDVVLLPGWQSITLVRALAAARLRRLPVLYRGDTHLGSAPDGWKRMLWRARTRAVLGAFSGYLAVGARARDYLMSFGLDHRRVFNSPHAVDVERFAAAAAPFRTPAGRARARARLGVPAHAFVVAFVGKLDRIKRPLDAVSAVGRLGPGSALLVAGSGALEADLRAEAERLGVTLAMPGFVNQGDLGMVYAAADCLAVPSRIETWGLVVNEALAAGCPAVVSDGVGCAPDLIDTSTGFTFPVGDVERFAAALDAVRQRGAAVYGDACRSRAARFDFAAATAGLAEACRAVLSPARPPSAAVRVVACCGNMVTVTGLERHTFQTLRSLRARGAAVHCIVNSWEHRRIVPLADEIGATWSIGAYYYPIRRRHLTPWRILRTMHEIARTSRGLLRDVRRTSATVVIVPDHVVTVRNAAALAWLRLRGRVRVVAQMGNAPEGDRFYARYWRYLQNPLTDRFVANSRYTASELLRSGVPASKISFVHNVLPPVRRVACVPEWTSRVPGRIVFVGQIIPMKGIDHLLEAVAIVRRRGIDASLDVVGDIDGWTTAEYRLYRDRLRARAAERDLAGHVSFLGWVEDVRLVFGRASLHCAPSCEPEGFGYVILEAKESGVPTVASPAGAYSELIAHGVNGWLCDDFSAEAIAAGIEHFLGDPSRLRLAGAAARASAAAFDADTYADFWWRAANGDQTANAHAVQPTELWS